MLVYFFERKAERGSEKEERKKAAMSWLHLGLPCAWKSHKNSCIARHRARSLSRGSSAGIQALMWDASIPGSSLMLCIPMRCPDLFCSKLKLYAHVLGGFCMSSQGNDWYRSFVYLLLMWLWGICSFLKIMVHILMCCKLFIVIKYLLLFWLLLFYGCK